MPLGPRLCPFSGPEVGLLLPPHLTPGLPSYHLISTASLSSGYHPQSNSQTEWGSQEMVAALHCVSPSLPPNPQMVDSDPIYIVKRILDVCPLSDGLGRLRSWGALLGSQAGPPEPITHQGLPSSPPRPVPWGAHREGGSAMPSVYTAPSTSSAPDSHRLSFLVIWDLLALFYLASLSTV